MSPAHGPHDLAVDNDNDATHEVKIANEPVTRARQAGAGVTFRRCRALRRNWVDRRNAALQNFECSGIKP